MASDYPEPPTHIQSISTTADSHVRARAQASSAADRAAFALASQAQAPSQLHGRHGETTSTEPEDHEAQLDPSMGIKRPRACEPCRQLKVRCDPDPTHPDGACKRCAKARRQCVVTAPSRKRQKKTDSRVTELERKIDALTATLQASHHSQLAAGAAVQSQAQPQSQPQQAPVPVQTREESNHSRRWLREDSSHLAGNKRHHDGFMVSQYPHPDSPSAEQIHFKQSQVPTPKMPHWRGPYAGETTPAPAPKSEFLDVIDRGLIDLETAKASFDRYVNRMAIEMPFVVFQPGTTMGQVRREKPTLFLAILGISVATFKKDLQMPLINECYRVIAEKVVVKGHKSLELIQALVVISIWYIPPDNLDELKFYQMIHMAIALAMELGLNRRSNGDLKPLKRIREMMVKNTTTEDMDLNGPEARRTWIACYFMGIQVATALRRMQLARWQPYMDESIQILETHPDALASDRAIIWWAKLGWIMEQAGLQLISDDTQSVVSFTDGKVRYTIKAFAKQLAQYRREIPEAIWTAPLAHTFFALELFVHESAMGVDCRDSIQPNVLNNEDLPATTMAPLIDALTTCINSIHKTFDVIMDVDVERFTCLPTLAIARTAYPVVSLIKIYSLLTAPESRIGQVIDMQSLKIEYYLEKVLNHYQTAAALDSGRVVNKFRNILQMLYAWFSKKKSNGPELREIFGAEMRSDNSSDKNPMKEGTTPLHVLSELAMEDPNNHHPENHPHQPRLSQGNLYSPASLNQEFGRNSTTPTQNPGSTNYGTTEPLRMGSMVSARSDPIAGPVPTTWSSTPSFSPLMPVSGMRDPNIGNRPYYPQFSSPQGPPQPYSMPNPPTPQYPEMSAAGTMPFGQSMGIIQGVPMDPNNLSALGTIMDEWLFGFPSAFDESFQF
ncbi:hypothetical protein N7528_005123 [Penicillium herquei]|nr:hypothetical protein N7528_005123 [Penicillium herquei]